MIITMEEKLNALLRLVTAMQGSQQEMKQDITGMKQEQKITNQRLTSIDEKIDQIAKAQVEDTCKLLEMRYGRAGKIEQDVQDVSNKIDVINDRLFKQEAEIKGLRRIK